MLKKLKHILNTYSDVDLEDMELWINSNDTVKEIIIDDYSINLISNDMYVTVLPEEEHTTIVCEEYKSDEK